MKISSIALFLLTILVIDKQYDCLYVRAFAPSQQGHWPSTSSTRSIRIHGPRGLINASSRLDMANGASSTEKEQAINLSLVAQSVANQAFIGSTIWTGGVGYQVLMQNSSFGPVGLVLGAIGSLLLLVFSKQVETSESPLVAGLNLSTNLSVLRLYGDTPKPVLALAVSLFLGGITGIVEEVTFRGQLLPTFAEWSATSLGVGGGSMSILFGAALSTFLFAILHTNPLSLLKGGEATIDNLVLLCFQLVTGSIFSILYLATGNLVVPIVAHFLYDTYTFYKTHLDVTGQMEYAKRESLMPVGQNAVEQKWEAEKGEPFVRMARETFYIMDTNRDGVLSRKELRVALFSYGLNISKLESEAVTQLADVDQSGSVDFSEFLEFVGPFGSTTKAVRKALLGLP